MVSACYSAQRVQAVRRRDAPLRREVLPVRRRDAPLRRVLFFRRRDAPLRRVLSFRRPPLMHVMPATVDHTVDARHARYRREHLLHVMPSTVEDTMLHVLPSVRRGTCCTFFRPSVEGTWCTCYLLFISDTDDAHSGAGYPCCIPSLHTRVPASHAAHAPFPAPGLHQRACCLPCWHHPCRPAARRAAAGHQAQSSKKCRVGTPAGPVPPSAVRLDRRLLPRGVNTSEEKREKIG